MKNPLRNRMEGGINFEVSALILFWFPFLFSRHIREIG